MIPVARIPKTTSGKVQRAHLLRDYLEGEFAGVELTFMGLNNQNLHNLLFRGFLKPWEAYTGATISWIDLAQADSDDIPDLAVMRRVGLKAAVGNATARALSFRTRDPRAFYYEDSAWFTAFVGGSHEFLRDGVRIFDQRVRFHYYATGITPAMNNSPIETSAVTP